MVMNYTRDFVTIIDGGVIDFVVVPLCVIVMVALLAGFLFSAPTPLPVVTSSKENNMPESTNMPETTNTVERLLRFKNLFEVGLSSKDIPLTKLKHICTYRLGNGVCLTLVHGKISDFPSSRGAIVNISNELFAPDDSYTNRAVMEAGGESFVNACKNVPIENTVRCARGGMKMLTGSFGRLKVRHIIQAVPPTCLDKNSSDSKKEQFKQTFKEDSNVLACIYEKALDMALANGCDQVIFPLFCAQQFSSDRPQVRKLIDIAVKAMLGWAKKRERNEVPCDIVLCATNTFDAAAMVTICDTVLEDMLKACII